MIDERRLRSLLKKASKIEKHERDAWLYGTRNERGHTYLHLALEYKSCRPYFETLFKDLFGCRDADSHSWDTGLTPFHIAVRQGYQECLKIMCRGCIADDLQVLDLEGGNTPLALAAAEGNYDAVRLILASCTKRKPLYGYRKDLDVFDIDHTNSSGKTALDLAMDNEHDTIVDLIEGMRKHLGNDKSDIALICGQRKLLYNDMRKAAEKSDHVKFRRLAQNIKSTTRTKIEDADFLKAILGELLRNAHQPKPRYRMVMDVLDAAFRCGEIKALLRHEYEGETALLLAAKGRHMALVHLLLTRGAKIDDEDKNNRNVLHMAAGCGNQNAVQFIINMKGYRLFHGLSEFVTHKDNDGKTPLHHVAQSGNSHHFTAEFLCGPWSAGLVEKDYNGFTPLHYAVQLFIKQYDRDCDFDNYQIETIYDKSSVKEQLKLFTGHGVRNQLFYRIFQEDDEDYTDPEPKEWYIASAIKLINLGYLRGIVLPIKEATLKAARDGALKTGRLRVEALHQGRPVGCYTVNDGMLIQAEPETTP